ncbi:MAG: hypothetical protein ACOZAG_00580 [Patescibacteria group bacterium]
MAKEEEKKSKEESKNKIKEKSSSSLFVFLLVSIFAVAAYFLIWPEYLRLSGTREKIVSRKQAMEDASKTFREINKLLENYSSIPKEESKKISTMLPEEVGEAGLFTLFETLAQKNKIIVLGVDISEKKPADNFKNLGIMEVHAALNLAASPESEDSYGDFKKFLSDIEANLRLMDITSINYTPETATYALNLKTYRVEEAQNFTEQSTP